jgi:hypothetical protein
MDGAFARLSRVNVYLGRSILSVTLEIEITRYARDKRCVRSLISDTSRPIAVDPVDPVDRTSKPDGFPFSSFEQAPSALRPTLRPPPSLTLSLSLSLGKRGKQTDARERSLSSRSALRRSIWCTLFRLIRLRDRRREREGERVTVRAYYATI